jgi:type IV secretory pathway TrbD component
MESPEAIICLHCGFNVQTREATRTQHILDTTGEDKFMWLLPGILAVIAVPVMLVIWILYHFCLPYWIFGDKWDEVIDLPGINGSRNKLAGDERLGQDSWYSLLFHYGIEVWVIVGFLFLSFFCIKFAVQRLILHPDPPEREK